MTSLHDELSEGTEEGVELTTSLSAKDGPVTSKQSNIAATTVTKKDATAKGQIFSKPQQETIEPVTVGRGSSKSNSHRNNQNSNSDVDTNNGSIKNDSPSTITATGKKSSTLSQSTSPTPASSETPIPPVKKIKTGSASSAAIRPSPLRTSVTTAAPNTSATNSSSKPPQFPAAEASPEAKKRKASVSNGSKPPSLPLAQGGNRSVNGYHNLKDEDDDEDVSDVNEGDDVVSDLSVKDLEQDQEQEARSSRPIRRDNAFRPSKKWPPGNSNASVIASTGLNSKSNGSATQGKIMVELTPRQPQVPPQPVFVIDKNQKARKWGKSGIVFHTLGGVVSIPLWTSDQEMLLNEPKPLFVKQPVSIMAAGRKDSSLARLAVLSQLDMDMDLDSPERGNTPDSMDGSSPGPTMPSLKKKRGTKKLHTDSKDENVIQGNGSSKLLAIRKALLNKRIHADSGNAIVVDDIDGDDDSVSINTAMNSTSKASSARSTPAPTQQRPRTFPCSFEGCNKSFMDKFHLDRHEARHVTEEIVCGIDGCTKAYNSISTVRRHQSMMHKDKKLLMDAAAAAEAEAEAGAESSNSNNSKSNPKNNQANSKKTIAKKGKSKSASTSAAATPEPVKMTLVLKDVKDSAYRPWMDSSESSTRMSFPLKDMKYHKSSSSSSSTSM
ncbi:hypothetical protein BGX27_002057 [Mortierella sp. AM989]|nr:hypothetical protein BGX27_002057 [Mortierella sp. AM989]